MNNYSYSDFDSLYAVLGAGLIIFVVLIIALAVVSIIANWKMFKKAGKKGWECIVPFYSYWVLIEIAGLNWWWFLLIIADSVVTTFEIDGLSEIAGLVSLFASFNCYYNIAKKFNKNTGTSIFAGLFSFIFILIFGFSKNEVYNSSIPVSKNGVFGSPEANNSYQGNNMNQSTNIVDNTNIQYNNAGYTEQKSNQDHSFCGNCGTKLNKDVRFCPNCGKENI